MPLKYDNPISVNKFVSLDGRFWYLVLDGNHRVAALHAKGEKQFKGILKYVYYETINRLVKMDTCNLLEEQVFLLWCADSPNAIN